MRIICIGDSLTYGYGVLKHERWTSIIGKAYNIEVINKGVNGDTTAGMLSRSYKDVILNKPSHVIIMGGTNDFLMGRGPQRVIENIEEFIKETKAYSIATIIGIEPQVDAVMASNRFEYGIDYNRVNRDIETYRRWIIDYCYNSKLTYIDFYNKFESLINDGNIKEFYIDGIHLTAKGHEIMAAEVDLS